MAGRRTFRVLTITSSPASKVMPTRYNKYVVTCTTSKRELLEEMGSQFYEEKIMFLFMFY